MRTLLILDGTNQFDEALSNARELCEPGDKLTILAVAETPAPAILGSRPAPANSGPRRRDNRRAAGTGPDLPVLEAEDDTNRRVAGALRDNLDEQAARLEANGIDLWTQAIVRDKPGEAVAAYVRSSDIDRIVFPRSSLPRLRTMLEGGDGKDALEGRLAPVIVLSA